LVQNFLTSDGARHRWSDEWQERNLTLPGVDPNDRFPCRRLSSVVLASARGLVVLTCDDVS